jgi:hypothetical protein
MAPKPIFILLLGSVLGFVQPQAGDSLPGPLPGMLNEMEKQLILKERNPKPHVESALKVAEARIKTAFQLAQENQVQIAARELDAFLALIIYADNYARKSLASKNKDRNNCLKQIEQLIFKQSRSLESITRALPMESREAADSRIGEVKKIRLRAINDLLGSGQVINSSNQ